MTGLMRRLACLAGVAAITAVVSPLTSPRAVAAPLNYSPVPAPLVAADWQPPLALPRAFRNHCHFNAEGRFYCSNHCGLDYQFYYCTQASFGCCRPGFGYCDWNGHLRCAPW
jgi:hypothetical protein